VHVWVCVSAGGGEVSGNYRYLYQFSRHSSRLCLAIISLTWLISAIPLSYNVMVICAFCSLTIKRIEPSTNCIICNRIFHNNCIFTIKVNASIALIKFLKLNLNSAFLTHWNIFISTLIKRNFNNTNTNQFWTSWQKKKLITHFVKIVT